MLTKYFSIKVKSEDFSKRLQNLGEQYKDKKLLLFCEKDVFNKLEELFGITKIFNISGVIYGLCKKTISLKNGIKMLKKEDLNKVDFDAVLSAQPCIPVEASSLIVGGLGIKDKDIDYLFEEEFRDEAVNLNIAYHYKLDKKLPKLIKKLNGKRVVLYGAGPFLEMVYKYFDFSGLNIVGVADRRFGNSARDTSREVATETFLGYKTYAPEKITEANPDYVIISTVYYTNIFEDLYFNILKGTKIKIIPLIEKPLLRLIREIWDLS